MPTTLENLKTAFAGESQANRKYLAYARKAEKEGFPKIAELFRTAAEAETIHALAHLENMGGVKSTLENLKDAIAGETYEFTEMYPPMVVQAKDEGHKARVMLGWAEKVEKVHADLYNEALAALEQGRDLGADVEFYLCPVCGHVESGKPEGRCKVCGAAAEKFTRL